MQVSRLDIRGLRSLRDVSLQPAAGMNLLVGPNGAGKTSVLEALHLMAYGRSFRGRVRDGLIRTGGDALEVFLEWAEGESGRRRRAGLRHGGSSWEGRLDEARVAHLGELCAAFMVVTFEPGSHSLVSGGAEPRRRFMDWGLFHVEPDFLPLWRRYARALKQRNALLKSGARGGQLAAWDVELAETGEAVTLRRDQYLQRLQGAVAGRMLDLAPALGQADVRFEPGWRSQQLSLLDALTLGQERDRMLGHTTAGPHRADWRLAVSAHPHGEALSRGQAKLVALACLLAQAQDCAAVRGDWPVIALDDLASELDRHHRERVLDTLQATGAQLFLTGTDVLEGVQPERVFHVEHGHVHPASA